MYCLVSYWYHCDLLPKFDINHANVQCLMPSPPCSGSTPWFREQNYLNLLWLLSLLKQSVIWCSSALRDTSWQQFQLFCWKAELQRSGNPPAAERVQFLPEPCPGSPGCLFSSDTAIVFVVCFFPRLCSSDIKYTARWSNETVFSSILISPKMITDHMPDVVLKALNSLSQEHGLCLSCQTREHNPSAV